MKIEPEKDDRILFAPDYKIAKNLLKLMDQSSKYDTFLPEFPVLHLRKSKITNLISAYKTSGLIHILQFMKDEENEKEWSKLLSIDNIETATRNIWRLSTSLHIAFMVAFIDTLSSVDKKIIIKNLTDQDCISNDRKWGQQFDTFMTQGSKTNATFALHMELMAHCDEVVAIAMAERLGGPTGYNLLLAAVKSSIPFSFLNGASSYGTFCVRLLYEHYKCGPFYKSMKHNLFSTPHNNSTVNFGLDTCREIDHRIAKKCVRPGSTMESLIPKMCTVDEQREVHLKRQSLTKLKNLSEHEPELEDKESAEKSSERFLGKKLTTTDKLHIYRTAKLIQRRNATGLATEEKPRNVYHTLEPELSLNILDRETYDVGKYLVLRHVAESNMFPEFEAPSISDYQGSKALISRVKRGQSVTINRTKIKANSIQKTKLQRDEATRQKKVSRMSKVLDRMSSKMNLCQAVVNADCTKHSCNKSMGVRKALLSLIKKCSSISESGTYEADSFNVENQVDNIDGLLMINFHSIPTDIVLKTKISIFEFAGVKFKSFATSGKKYLDYVSSIVKQVKHQLPNLKHIVICEEKYMFTPDDFKQATRKKRQKGEKISISHLKEESEVLSDERLSKVAVTSTSLGKQLIGTYLGRHLQELQINDDLTIDVDSEYVVIKCNCSKVSTCNCKPYSIPLRATFSKENGCTSVSELRQIHQRKGEGEMAQIDWLPEIIPELAEGEGIVNFVSSADIDTIVIHLFATSLHWPRNTNGSFKHQLHVWLNKAKPDLYNITGIISVLEKFLKVKHVAVTVAVALCIAGNDFLPNFSGISHEAVLTAVVNNEDILTSLLTFSYNSAGKVESCKINENTYLQLIHYLYCPSYLNSEMLTFEEVRQLSIKLPNQSIKRPPQQWMPPKTALQQLCKVTQCQIDYLLTSWNHGADLPNFLDSGCLIKNDEGDVFYDLGPHIHIDDEANLLEIPEAELLDKIKSAKKVQRTKKRALVQTPQKPEDRKRQPKMSTPRYSYNFK